VHAGSLKYISVYLFWFVHNIAGYYAATVPFSGGTYRHGWSSSHIKLHDVCLTTGVYLIRRGFSINHDHSSTGEGDGQIINLSIVRSNLHDVI